MKWVECLPAIFIGKNLFVECAIHRQLSVAFVEIFSQNVLSEVSMQCVPAGVKAVTQWSMLA